MKNRLGKISKEKDGFKVHFERELNHSIQKVWDAITDPEQLKYWFTDIEMDFRPGGKITFIFRDKANTKSYGEIVSIEPPKRFVWTWEGELAVWELFETGKNKCTLVFTYSKLPDGYAINAPAGFHSLLDLLEKTLGGSKEIYPFGAEENDPEQIKMKVLYAASVYNDYPDIVKAPPVVVEKIYNASVKKVWRAITDKEQMKQWYFDLDDFVAEEGFEFQFPGQGHKGAQYMHLCKITEVIPFKKLQYSWEYKGHPGYSIVMFELFEQGDKVKVRLTHHGLDTFPQDNSDFAIGSFTEGWNSLIGTHLKDFVENKKSLSSV